MLLPPAGSGRKRGKSALAALLCGTLAVPPPLTVKRVTRYSKTITSSHNRTALALSLQDYLIPQSTARSPGRGNTPYRWAGTGALRPMGEPLDDIIAILSEPVAADKVSRPPSLPPRCHSPEYIHSLGGGSRADTAPVLDRKVRSHLALFALSDSVTSLG